MLTVKEKQQRKIAVLNGANSKKLFDKAVISKSETYKGAPIITPKALLIFDTLYFVAYDMKKCLYIACERLEDERGFISHGDYKGVGEAIKHALEV